MEKKQLDLQMQKLNSEYSKKMNEIARKKEDLNAAKQISLFNADEEFYAKRNDLLKRIGDLRQRRAELFDGDPQRAQLELDKLDLQNQITVLRDDNEQRKRDITHKAYAQRRDLDEECRKLSEWLQAEKVKLMEQYVDNNHLNINYLLNVEQ